MFAGPFIISILVNTLILKTIRVRFLSTYSNPSEFGIAPSNDDDRVGAVDDDVGARLGPIAGAFDSRTSATAHQSGDVVGVGTGACESRRCRENAAENLFQRTASARRR